MILAPGTPTAPMSRIDTVSLPSAALETLEPVCHSDYQTFLDGLKLITGNGHLHPAREAKKRFAEITHGKSVEHQLIEDTSDDSRAVTVAVKMFTDDSGTLRFIDEISTIRGAHFMVQTHGYAIDMNGFTLDEPRAPSSVDFFMLSAMDTSGSIDAALDFTSSPNEAQTIADIQNVYAIRAVEMGIQEAMNWLKSESSWGEFVKVISM